MSWIDDEANENVKRESSETRRENLIRQSQYWARLLRQIEADVNAINSHGYWTKKLAGFPLRFGETPDGGGYQVSKSGYPAITVAFRHRGDSIKVERRFIENPLSRDFQRSEDLAADTSGDNVILMNGKKEAFIVPEEASHYILKAIIESLKITVSAPE